ncbi:cysteine desulfurase [Rhodococcus sp. BP-252]|uniref:cysteine desulfurase family protein n=1 Tax=unclassified Rhodococcus (in: high G+C Gram-positive bacteria) TaxID=192944 RepID=UPI001C9B4ED6|nr:MULTISPECIES: cysteine desulfurase family protein [unclassified Rhodococcus (in: high G+C Gram-positive bacteria)]MBY6411205.1 cysteine desulfurase [Rhodococcus sp. BP-320]MBY6415864.1 cysteine desulfurase [Rhodococcus sp. BP-321]MBY6423640.1 cysteine desulfurase [Rhodococcus sp. BP-324]MBY6425809.1 cysteine desulfurase [Rhodococcus sp. BP-323]MBY6431070.1 cysteine desulfurase [Rhodococcus sp. BP-322]
MPSARSSAATTASSAPVYLDHAATTPMSSAAIEAMTAVFATVGNASSLHGSGRLARRRVEEARESIAENLGARPSEVIFTSGGTESDNLAVKGIFAARRDAEPSRTRIVASSVEHHAVLDAVEWLAAHEGADVTWLPVDASGRVQPDTLRAELALRGDEIALITVMWANNEVGTIMPIAELAAVAQEYGIPMHSDAIQAVPHLPVDFAASGLSALSIAAHKFGGPQGVGALLLGRSVPCVPLLHGGGHERDVRSGTHDTASVVAMAAALKDTVDTRSARHRELTRLREKMIAGVRAIDPDVIVNGAQGDGGLDSIAHFTFPGCEGDSLLMLLDAAGIECSTGSACTAGVARASHVLIAMGADPVTARGSLRFSLGAGSSDDDVDRLLAALPQVTERARAAGLASVGARGGQR